MLKAVCESTVDPEIVCSSPVAGQPDCLGIAIGAIRDSAANRSSFCATNSDPGACASILESVLPAAEAYLDPAAGCTPWLSVTNPACAEHLAAVNRAFAIPDPVTAVEDLAADLGVAISDAGMRNAMCVSNALVEMSEVTIALGQRSSVAQVQSCALAKGNGGNQYYRVTNERAPSGAVSAWDPTRSKSNWLRIKTCEIENTTQDECVNRVSVIKADGSEVSGSVYQDVQGAGAWIGKDYYSSPKRGRPQCQFVGHLSSDWLKGWERFSCYFAY